MKRVVNLSPILPMLGLLFFCSFFSAAAFADTPDKTFVSRTTEIDGVKLHYTTGGHGPALILLHGYAETSRMWAPVLLCSVRNLRSSLRICRESGIPRFPGAART